MIDDRSGVTTYALPLTGDRWTLGDDQPRVGDHRWNEVDQERRVTRDETQRDRRGKEQYRGQKSVDDDVRTMAGDVQTVADGQKSINAGLSDFFLCVGHNMAGTYLISGPILISVCGA
ncbi:MAG TPA: hypothetical protein VGH81_09470 [Rudaea sp.]|jgi:hypothetical protein